MRDVVGSSAHPPTCDDRLRRRVVKRLLVRCDLLAGGIGPIFTPALILALAPVFYLPSSSRYPVLLLASSVYKAGIFRF